MGFGALQVPAFWSAAAVLCGEGLQTISNLRVIQIMPAAVDTSHSMKQVWVLFADAATIISEHAWSFSSYRSEPYS